MDTLQQPEMQGLEKEGEEKGMSEAKKHRGLCSTCKNASTCTYPRDPNRPVSCCCEHEGYEECEGSVSLALLTTGGIFGRARDSAAESSTASKDARTDEGLCKNCGNRQTCTFPKPEGGVWHCEEYQ